ncbi:hypothetical protein [Salibacter halophilus]|uniref:Signal transduction histidine kinase dimerisation/phosphoacceptor domain-containing protein n=1 Tax=Salibacter halophilus TaxID=1803916 RepID=A0A6N6MAI0_9FLAO|nr:hypothetical protein [Salibacter halophilus]KAB1065999.1 hypothetical protein F3059_00575 [Salibacter halophilus]
MMLRNTSNAVYRVAYESVSKLSRKLNAAKNIDELSSVFDQYLKYLFNFNALRVHIVVGSDHYYFVFPLKDENETEFWENEVLNFEEGLLENGVPICQNLNAEQANSLIGDDVQNPVLWGWNFQYEDYCAVTSLIADENNQFSSKETEILGLVVDLFTLKYYELITKAQLVEKNKLLEEAVDIIKQKNNWINQIISDQQNVIDERTKQLRYQNEQLMQLSVLNAHQVREPLSRVMGLLDLISFVEGDEFEEEILPKMKESAKDLDEALQVVINKSIEEIVNVFDINSDKM